MMLAYKNNTHIPGISTHYFAKDAAIWRKWTRFDCRRRGDFILQFRQPYAPYWFRRRLLRTYTTSFSQFRGR